MESAETMEQLKPFRDRLFACLGRRSDALFELTDAILTAGIVTSPPHLSLTPIHRRGWGGLYAALAKGEVDNKALRDLFASHPLGDNNAQGTPPVYVVDVTSWPRSDAEASPERGYYYHPSRHFAGQPIVTGWAYQLIAEIRFAHDTWVAPVHGLARTPGGLEHPPRVEDYLRPSLGLQGSSVDEAAWTMSTTISASFVPRSFLEAVRYPWVDASSHKLSRPKLAGGASYAKTLWTTPCNLKMILRC